MKAKLSFYIILILHLVSAQLFCFNAITYQQSAGRLGDQLIYYCLAKYISFKYDLRFYIKPFPFWDKLAFSSSDNRYNETIFKNFEKILIRNEAEFLKYRNEAKNQLFIIDHTHWQTSSPDSEWYGVDSSKAYRKLLRKLISPTFEIPKLQLPPDCITVALHYRTGEDFDSQVFIKIQRDENNTNPKFRPFCYYVNQIKHLKDMFPNQKLYIYIFTDAVQPKKVLDSFKKAFSDPLIIFVTRENTNSWNQNTLIDLFHMAQFDCLIRPRSAFSFIAQLIGFHKLVLHPKGILWIDQLNF